MNSIEKLMTELKEREEAIGKERDKLDELISSAQDLLDDCVDAIFNLQEARDALSKVV